MLQLEPPHFFCLFLISFFFFPLFPFWLEARAEWKRPVSWRVGAGTISGARGSEWSRAGTVSGLEARSGDGQWGWRLRTGTVNELEARSGDSQWAGGSEGGRSVGLEARSGDGQWAGGSERRRSVGWRLGAETISGLEARSGAGMASELEARSGD
eukprot:g35115.t1